MSENNLSESGKAFQKAFLESEPGRPKTVHEVNTGQRFKVECTICSAPLGTFIQGAGIRADKNFMCILCHHRKIWPTGCCAKECGYCERRYPTRTILDGSEVDDPIMREQLKLITRHWRGR